MTRYCLTCDGCESMCTRTLDISGTITDRAVRGQFPQCAADKQIYYQPIGQVGGQPPAGNGEKRGWGYAPLIVLGVIVFLAMLEPSAFRDNMIGVVVLGIICFVSWAIFLGPFGP